MAVADRVWLTLVLVVIAALVAWWWWGLADCGYKETYPAYADYLGYAGPLPYAPEKMLAGTYFPVEQNLITQTM